ncbi:MAG: hypothetical protein A2W19_09325 [Spirochaetes bacterium RBG_16_49_21]|nr:MAG: hypothetical protein A2W19_09325 [Spirochaetes bacterium RBG_16_49_21]
MADNIQQILNEPDFSAMRSIKTAPRISKDAASKIRRKNGITAGSHAAETMERFTSAGTDLVQRSRQENHRV